MPIREEPDGTIVVFGENFNGLLTPPAGLDDADVYEGCNWSQTECRWVNQGRARGQRLFPDIGSTNSRGNQRTYRACNLANSEPHPGATLEGCGGAVFKDQPRDLVANIDGIDIDDTQQYRVTYGSVTDTAYLYTEDAQIANRPSAVPTD